MKRITNSLLLLVSLWTLNFVQPIYSADIPSPATDLQQQVQKLKTENEALKQENQALRKLLFEKQNTAQKNLTAQPQPNSPTKASGGEKQPTTSEKLGTEATTTGYWMTTSSGKRHNSTCRYYQNSNGHPCSQNDGIPCKICGG